jgi:hypothetical protein
MRERTNACVQSCAVARTTRRMRIRHRNGTTDALEPRCVMTEIVILAVTLALYGACAAFVRFCDRM